MIRIALMLLVWGVLLGWHLTANRLGCPVAAALLALAAGLMALSGMEVAFYRRHAFLRHYLVPEGFLFRVLGRRVLILIRQGIKSLLLAFVLLIVALGFDWPQWLLLLADVFLLAALLAAFGASFLVVWAYSRALVGTITRPWAVWLKPSMEDPG